MPPVIAAVAVTAATAAAGVALGAVTIGSAVLSVAATALTAGGSYLLQEKTPPIDTNAASKSAAPVNAQRNIPVRQATPPRRFVYGRCRVGGAVIFQDNVNPFLYIACALSDGEINGVVDYYFGDVVIPVDGSGEAESGSEYVDRFVAESANGTTDQAASTLLTDAFPELGSTFRQRGVARAVVALHWGTDSQQNSVLWGSSINPTFDVEGVKVYDPRDAAQDLSDATTWIYSDNPALCIGHALTHIWGLALDTDSVDWASFGAAADDCDVEGFELAGVLQADADVASQINDMLQACGGTLYFSNGKYGLYIEKARAAVWTITDDDILEYGEYVHDGEMERSFNVVKARYYDGEEGGVAVTTPPYEDAAAIADEGRRETAVDLRFVAASRPAQILAYRHLYRTRDQRALTLRTTDAAIYLRPGEVVTLASEVATYLNGDFVVTQVDLADVGASLYLVGYNSDMFADPDTYVEV